MLDEDLVSLANEALARMGGGMINIDDESDLAGLVQKIVPSIVKARLTKQAWSFATFTLQLERDDSQIWRAGYQYAFLLPGGRLQGPLRVSPGNSTEIVRDFRIENDFLFASQEKIFGSFIMQPSLEKWPPLFREAIVIILAHAFTMAIPQKMDFAQEFKQMAFGLPSERGRGGIWGEFVLSEMQQSCNRSPIAQGDWLSNARF